MLTNEDPILALHLVGGQVIVACLSGTLLKQPYELVAIPPSEKNPKPSFAMYPFGAFYGLLKPVPALAAQNVDYIHYEILTPDHPVRQFYINSINSKGPSQ